MKGTRNSSAQLSSFAWCIKFRNIFKTITRRMEKLKIMKNKDDDRELNQVRRKSSRNKFRWTDFSASFAFSQQRSYKKLPIVPQISSERSSSSSTECFSSFSFRNNVKEEERSSTIKPTDESRKQSEDLQLKWKEVVEMVTAAESFDDLVDLEEFLGYYLLLRCPVFTALIHSFFKEFCSEFCDEELQTISLFIPELQEFPSFVSSERELECLPPSPYSKQQSLKLSKR